MTEFEAATNEAEGKTPSMDIGGKTITFPAQLPPGIAAAVQMGRADVVYRILAGDDEDTLTHLMIHMTEEDFDQVAGLYGLTAEK